MSKHNSSLRKSPRGARKPVERIIPIRLEDEEEKVSTPPSQKKPEQKESVKSPWASSSLKPETKKMSGPNARRGLRSSASKDSLNVSEDGSLSDSNGLCTSVNQLSLTPVDVSKEKQSEDNKINIPERSLPPYNVPERVILVLDRAKDEISSCFELNNGSKFSPLHMLKHSLMFFLNNKNVFDSKHEFALVILNENGASWIHDFTNDVNSIIDTFDEIEECETEDIFDLNTVFDLIIRKVSVNKPASDLLIPPQFIVRTIFMYGRSITMPVINMTEEISNLLNSPYFTFDVLMTHEVPDTSNKCNNIFKHLQNLDTKGFAYFFPVSRSSSELHHAIAKLLSHPLQRASQRTADYKLRPDKL